MISVPGDLPGAMTFIELSISGNRMGVSIVHIYASGRTDTL